MSDVLPICAWDGNLDAWDDWYSRWRTYSSVVFKHASEEILMFLLLKYLPAEYQEPVISHVQNGQWNYGMAVAHIESEVARMVPTLKRIQRWHESKPTGGYCAALQAWYPARRTRMHGLCINEKVVGEQFVETMQ